MAPTAALAQAPTDGVEHPAGIPAETRSDALAERSDAIRLENPEASAWPEAVEAIAFELDQAGYVAVTDAVTPASAAIVVEREGDTWRLQCTDVYGRAHEERGPVAEGPDFVALIAVELLLASRTNPAAVDPPAKPVASATHKAAPGPGRDDASVTPTLRAGMAPPRTGLQHWAVELGASASNIGLLGLSLGVHRRWTRTELGLFAEAGTLDRREEEVSVDGSVSSIELGAFARGALTVAYVFRPERRVRPSLGLASEFVFPFVRSTYTGVDPFVPTPGTVQARSTDAGLMWVPSAAAALRIALRPRLALRLAARVGPALTVRAPQLASGGNFAFDGWFVGVTTGFVFGSTGDWSAG